MVRPAGLLVMLVFAVLAGLHGYWALGGRRGFAAAVPEIGGRAAFQPPRWATATVAAGLLGCAGLVAALLGMIALPVGPGVLTTLGYGLAAILALRAIGDFKLVGFTKRRSGSRFARLDTVFYSPLCAALSAGVGAVTLAA